jgi:hypothetical protein
MSDDPTSNTLCELFVKEVPVSGASITVFGNSGAQSTICTSDEIAARLDELQFDLGEGPRWEAARTGSASISDDLSGDAHPEWPVFGAAASQLGVGALFSFPIRIGTRLLGIADLYRRSPGPLGNEAHLRALSISHRIAGSAARHGSASADSPAAVETRDAPALRREVHQATGMILMQLEVGVAEAFDLLRAHAFAHDSTVEDVARDVVARRLDFRELSW